MDEDIARELLRLTEAEDLKPAEVDRQILTWFARNVAKLRRPGQALKHFSVFAQSTEGAVHFNVSVRVDMAEFSGWQPNRIAAFFDGIAKVLAAKANIEEEEATK